MSTETFVIVGGGLAAARAVEAIREGGRQGPLILIGDEATLPYDRPPLSKAVLAGTEVPETALLHPAQWYRERNVDLSLGLRATRLDTSAHTLTVEGRGRLTWDRLLIATGSSPRRLAVPGADLRNVLYLRTMGQATTLRDRLRSGQPVVIVGAGWIGLEVAAAARAHGCEVTVVEPQPTPLHAVVGAQIGRYFVDLHTAHGVAFRLGTGVDRLVGNSDGAVSGVVTTTGEHLAAATVLVGVGITPNTILAQEAGIEVDNGIRCDESLRTSSPDVFAAGDVANWFNPTLQQHIRVDHWSNAQESGFAAGRSMVGEQVHHDVMPYFFSDQYDAGLEYAGHVPRGTATEVVLRGDPADDAFMAFWLAEGRVLAGMHVNVWDTIDDVQALIASRSTVDPQVLADPREPIVTKGQKGIVASRPDPQPDPVS
ncbi:MAG: FAD-dependent oxidoreductase [Humibacillus sp.]|nr:FAD-dependent oxidoreductase [Humibacillus sp.]MDN5776358.1 FAD-dependent oxidoreductase [Humibacillus sp.]